MLFSWKTSQMKLFLYKENFKNYSAEDIAQLAECSHLVCMRAWLPCAALYKWHGGANMQSQHSGSHREFKASLGCLQPCSKTPPKCNFNSGYHSCFLFISDFSIQKTQKVKYKGRILGEGKVLLIRQWVTKSGSQNLSRLQ